MYRTEPVIPLSERNDPEVRISPPKTVLAVELPEIKKNTSVPIDAVEKLGTRFPEKSAALLDGYIKIGTEPEEMIRFSRI